MTIQRLFPTQVYCAPLQRSGWKPLNGRLLRECLQLRHDDPSGRRWSLVNYPGGYTSYNSASRMHEVSPTFAAFARSLELDLASRLRARQENRQWVLLPATAGRVVLFESWLRHEVPPNAVAAGRVSISFNYNWF